MFNGVFGTERRIWNTIRDISMLLCIGIGLAPAFKMKFWNIGAEGQILLGGIAAAACMMYFDSLPNGLLLVVMFLAAAAAGGFWAFIPGISKAKLNTNETLFTLMMNYIAIQLTSFFVTFGRIPMVPISSEQSTLNHTRDGSRTFSGRCTDLMSLSLRFLP